MTRKQVCALLAVTGTTAAGIAAYAVGVERNSFRVHRENLAVLPPGSETVRLLHITDLHLVPRQRRKAAWVRALTRLRPDLVVNTGDSLAHAKALPAVKWALDPLLDLPGMFVLGNNDYLTPTLKSPHRYFRPPRVVNRKFDLPWAELRSALASGGWLDLNNATGQLRVPGLTIACGGVDDFRMRRSRFLATSGHADEGSDGLGPSYPRGGFRGSGSGLSNPESFGSRGSGNQGAGNHGAGHRGAGVRIGLTHEPEPALLDKFAADGYDLVLAGHTHGGQVRVPGFGAVVTNCGLDRRLARGTFTWPRPDGDVRSGVASNRTREMLVHVSAGLGTSPFAPIRFCCPPEVSLLQLVARPSQ